MRVLRSKQYKLIEFLIILLIRSFYRKFEED